jgi:hypothetical protein
MPHRGEYAITLSLSGAVSLQRMGVDDHHPRDESTMH